MSTEMMDIYEYSTLIEDWYKNRYNVEFDAYNCIDDKYAEKFELDMGIEYEYLSKNGQHVYLTISDKDKFFLNKIKYGFSSSSTEIYCED